MTGHSDSVRGVVPQRGGTSPGIREPSGLPNLLFVEDEPRIGAITSELLGDDYEVDWAQTGEEGLVRALAQHYSVMVLDRRLPGIDGVELTRRIRRAGISTPVLMLTALDRPVDIVSGLDGGVNDYLAKPFDVDVLLARLRALRRGFAAQRERVHIGEWEFSPRSRTVLTPTGGRVQLTATEAQLLSLLADSPAHVFSRREIHDAVFRSSDGLGVVETYVHYLRRKTTSGIVDTVRGIGYRLGSPQ